MTTTIEDLAAELDHVERDAREVAHKSELGLAAGLIARALAVSSRVNLAHLAERQASEQRLSTALDEDRAELLAKLSAAIDAADLMPVLLARIETLEAAVTSPLSPIRSWYLDEVDRIAGRKYDPADPVRG